jgi:hypothetical protein
VKTNIVTARNARSSRRQLHTTIHLHDHQLLHQGAQSIEGEAETAIKVSAAKKETGDVVGLHPAWKTIGDPTLALRLLKPKNILVALRAA